MNFRKLIPLPLRKILLKRYQKIVFHGALRKMSNMSVERVDSEAGLIQDLIFGWGNQGYSAKFEYLRTCIDYANRCEGTILECGSGLTSIVIGFIAKKRGLRMVSLEDNALWANRVKQYLNRLQLDNVDIIVRPLKNYGNFDWYDISEIGQAHDFTLILCDGPPERTFGGRYGLMPLFGSKMKAGTIILMDDTSRSTEQQILEKWNGLVPLHIQPLGTNGNHSVVSLLSA